MNTRRTTQRSSALACILFVPLQGLLAVGCGDEANKSGAPSASGSARPAASVHAASSASAAASSATAAASATSSATAAASADEVPPPYSGKLTVPMVMYAGKAVHPFDAWDDAMTKLEKLAGKPTDVVPADKKNSRNPESCWSAVETDRAACFCIEKTTFEALKRENLKGPAVGATDNPILLDSTSPSGNWDICRKHAGKK